MDSTLPPTADGMNAVMYELHCVVNFARMSWYAAMIETRGYTDDKGERAAEFDTVIANNPRVTLRAAHWLASDMEIRNGFGIFP